MTIISAISSLAIAFHSSGSLKRGIESMMNKIFSLEL
jgi:hypothetical protein